MQVGEAVLAQRRLGFRRRLLDAQAQRRHDVRAARLRGHGAVAGLGHGHAGGRHHERDGGRDVEGAAHVAAGAAGIDGPAGAGTASARERIARTKPASSPAVSPRACMPTSMPPNWAGVTRPSRTAAMKPSAASGERAPPVETVRSASRMASVVGSVTAALRLLVGMGPRMLPRRAARAADGRAGDGRAPSARRRLLSCAR